MLDYVELVASPRVILYELAFSSKVVKFGFYVSSLTGTFKGRQ
jgi:hypothetical protein